MKRKRMTASSAMFMPSSRDEMEARGWDQVDVVLVTGDAYVDHPSFGVALIGRWLEAHGYRVAILAQPRWNSAESFRVFGRPRLFWGITSGNLDSVVSNYTGNARIRKLDAYSPYGNPYFGHKKVRSMRRRPDRAVILYANLARQAFGDVPVVIGGIEASLRRFVHYDYQQEKIRGSVLADSKADVLVYGMGELAVLEIARRIESGDGLHGIRGTCVRVSDAVMESYLDSGTVVLPSYDDIRRDASLFLDAELMVDEHARALSGRPVVQRQQSMWVVQYPSQPVMKTGDLDLLYSLPFVRAPHPDAGDVPAFRMIEHSITALRGCYGNCSFCAIARHQGPVVVSRSIDSVAREAKKIALSAGFKGVISDVGGPTANMYGTFCKKHGNCRRHDCLFPSICRHLDLAPDALSGLLDAVCSVDGVKKVFLSSGLRMDMLVQTPELFEKIICCHQPGAIKIAPEHVSDRVLYLMHKPGHRIFAEFIRRASSIAEKRGKAVHFIPYIVSAHPGCDENDMKEAAEEFKRMGIRCASVQDFTPSPGTVSAAMYVSGLDRYRKKRIYVARSRGARKKQRRIIQAVL